MRTKGNSLKETFRMYCPLCHLEETTFSWRAKLLGVDVQYWKWFNKVNVSLPSVLSLCDCRESDHAISSCVVKYPDDLVRLGH